jgi:hypothetical protein
LWEKELNFDFSSSFDKVLDWKEKLDNGGKEDSISVHITHYRLLAEFYTSERHQKLLAD